MKKKKKKINNWYVVENRTQFMQNILKNAVNFLVANISTHTTSGNGLEIAVTTTFHIFFINTLV